MEVVELILLLAQTVVQVAVQVYKEQVLLSPVVQELLVRVITVAHLRQGHRGRVVQVAARALRETATPTSPTDAKRRITVCVKAVAGLLGNTPTVCRSSYVHPAVFDLYQSGRLGEVLPGPEAASFERALVKALRT